MKAAIALTFVVGAMASPCVDFLDTIACRRLHDEYNACALSATSRYMQTNCNATCKFCSVEPSTQMSAIPHVLSTPSPTVYPTTLNPTTPQSTTSATTPAPTSCIDDSQYFSRLGHSCKTWQGYTCTQAWLFGYTAGELDELLSSCRLSCDLCQANSSTIDNSTSSTPTITAAEATPGDGEATKDTSWGPYLVVAMSLSVCSVMLAMIIRFQRRSMTDQSGEHAQKTLHTIESQSRNLKSPTYQIPHSPVWGRQQGWLKDSHQGTPKTGILKSQDARHPLALSTSSKRTTLSSQEPLTNKKRNRSEPRVRFSLNNSEATGYVSQETDTDITSIYKEDATKSPFPEVTENTQNIKDIETTVHDTKIVKDNELPRWLRELSSETSVDTHDGNEFFDIVANLENPGGRKTTRRPMEPKTRAQRSGGSSTIQRNSRADGNYARKVSKVISRSEFSALSDNLESNESSDNMIRDVWLLERLMSTAIAGAAAGPAETQKSLRNKATDFTVALDEASLLESEDGVNDSCEWSGAPHKITDQHQTDSIVNPELSMQLIDGPDTFLQKEEIKRSLPHAAVVPRVDHGCSELEQLVSPTTSAVGAFDVENDEELLFLEQEVRRARNAVEVAISESMENDGENHATLLQVYPTKGSSIASTAPRPVLEHRDSESTAIHSAFISHETGSIKQNHSVGDQSVGGDSVGTDSSGQTSLVYANHDY